MRILTEQVERSFSVTKGCGFFLPNLIFSLVSWFNTTTTLYLLSWLWNYMPLVIKWMDICIPSSLSYNDWGVLKALKYLEALLSSSLCFNALGRPWNIWNCLKFQENKDSTGTVEFSVSWSLTVSIFHFCKCCLNVDKWHFDFWSWCFCDTRWAVDWAFFARQLWTHKTIPSFSARLSCFKLYHRLFRSYRPVLSKEIWYKQQVFCKQAKRNWYIYKNVQIKCV